ncbi:hypothetical protein [uncultured Thiohalocapsa sp.]|uniref:hypothetical protein n=1 Tax=uncultured Thiohalocapsa sp. TaxID=768990 RepID=UPI0025FA30E2|nr:hypothetical protein [uncultured Thiohalocapsa sp.]
MLFWIGLLLLLYLVGILSLHLHFLLFVWVPLCLGLLLVWGVAIPAGNSAGFGLGSAEAYRTALIALRIGAFAALLQLCFVPLLHRSELVVTLTAWGLRGSALVLAVASMTLIDDLRYRVDQVMSARIARGLAARNTLSRVLQLPAMLRPLLVFVLTSAVRRSELWTHRGLERRLAQIPVENGFGSRSVSVLILAGAIAWLAASLLL